jgi:hypothetical protein
MVNLLDFVDCATAGLVGAGVVTFEDGFRGWLVFPGLIPPTNLAALALYASSVWVWDCGLQALVVRASSDGSTYALITPTIPPWQ